MRALLLAFACMLGCHGNYFSNEPDTARQSARFLQACMEQNRVKGTPSQLRLVPGDASGILFDAPRFCPGENGEQGASIRVLHHGRRRLDYGRSEANDCDRPHADATQCPSVSVHVFGHAVLDALRKELGELNADTMGLGLCAKASDPFEKWELSCRIHDWRYADQALQIIHAELKRWDIEGEWHLGITGITCAVAG